MFTTRLTRHLLAAFMILGPAVALAAAPPNVLVIVGDDQAWTDFGFMGHKVIRTPHLDRLAGESLLFVNGYVTAPVCRPSLASIMTGQYGWQTKICGNDPPQGVPRSATHQFIGQVPTFPRLLQQAGYVGLQTGKFWEGDFANAGFTHGSTDEESRHGSKAGLRIGRDGLTPVYEFITAAGAKPWMVWYAPMMPHDPHTPPERILQRYLAASRPEKLARYWAMCEWFDETCGELLGWLGEHGQLENTLIIYVTDNGWIQGTGPKRTNRGWFADRSKLSPYDGGLRTPIIVRPPGPAKPRRMAELASSADLAPTILRACGIQPPAAMRGVSLLDVAAGRVSIADRPVFSEVYLHTERELSHPAANLEFRVVRRGRWKLIDPLDPGRPLELYDMIADPYEKGNMAVVEPNRVAELRKLLDAWWKPAIPVASQSAALHSTSSAPSSNGP